MTRLAKTLYRLSLPLLRLYLKRTQRVYAIIEWQDQILAVRLRFGDQTWSLPGGGKKRREGWHEALARELHEELGLLISTEQLTFVADGVMERDRLGYQYKIYRLTLPAAVRLKPRRFEILEAAFLPKNTQAYTELHRSLGGSVLE